MTATSSAAELRRWLVDYLITNIACNAGDIDFDASFSDVGVGSRDAVVVVRRTCRIGGPIGLAGGVVAAPDDKRSD